jgi:hypothetical protein
VGWGARGHKIRKNKISIFDLENTRRYVIGFEAVEGSRVDISVLSRLEV